MRILDTDICVEILRGNTGVIEQRRATIDRVATTWITAAELYYGAARSVAPEKNQGLVTELLESLEIHGLNTSASRQFGRLKAELERQGQRLADADLLIASVALVHGATLVTGNVRHYDRIPDLEIEDWIRGRGLHIHEPHAPYGT
ncbi:MAG: type II toxin-antitoxin system VapC family toxin [bacterium]|nr:type II toxin-antitoxin system VapC family toxin [bacterium]